MLFGEGARGNWGAFALAAASGDAPHLSDLALGASGRGGLGSVGDLGVAGLVAIEAIFNCILAAERLLLEMLALKGLAEQEQLAAARTADRRPLLKQGFHHLALGEAAQISPFSVARRAVKQVDAYDRSQKLGGYHAKVLAIRVRLVARFRDSWSSMGIIVGVPARQQPASRTEQQKRRARQQ